ncbi:DUF2946 domain-containing protein [Enterobacteriaceae bacterium 4M9]|nr:DUF2946 domain-containing protein [Enterobacteriaceae bacterium 4M9]
MSASSGSTDGYCVRTLTGNITHRAAWLALLAMMLIVVAPQISLSLQQFRQAPVHAPHHEMPMMDMAQHEAGHPDAAHEEHAACGYCVLLAHTPGLLMPALMLLLAHGLLHQPLPFTTRLAGLLACCRGRPPCRAPPLR